MAVNASSSDYIDLFGMSAWFPVMAQQQGSRNARHDDIAQFGHCLLKLNQAVSERYGHAILITKNFDTVRIEKYGGIFCPGGRSPETLQLNKNVNVWIQQLFEAGKPVASICNGVQMLATAGILCGRKCTGHPCCEPQSTMGGGIWESTNKIDTVVDGNLYTASEWTGTSGLLAAFASALGVRWSSSY